MKVLLVLMLLWRKDSALSFAPSEIIVTIVVEALN